MNAVADATGSPVLRPFKGGTGMDSFALTQFVLDDYSMRILCRIDLREESAVELSSRCGIPIAACYRRLRKLEELGLVAAAREERAPNGHRTRFFRSRVKSARIFLESGRLWARVDLLPGGPENEPHETLRGSFENEPAP